MLAIFCSGGDIYPQNVVTAVQILVPISKVGVVRLMQMDYFVAEKRSVVNGKKTFVVSL